MLKQKNNLKFHNRANTPSSKGKMKIASWRAALADLEGAYAANTIRSYRADFTIFETWCKEQDRTALPASPATVAAFVQAQSKSAAPATVSRRRASIAKIHVLLKLDSPVRTEEVNLATRKMFRQQGRRQHQVLGLTAALKRRLLATCRSDLVGLRDRALISTGYDTLCRRSELVHLLIEDLDINPDGSGTVLIRRAKADQLGDGRLAYLSAETIRYIKKWLHAAKLDSGPIFHGIHATHISARALNPYAIPLILKSRASEAGFDTTTISKLSGHSMRVGAAQDMAAAGIDLIAIMHAGGWKSPNMVLRYIEHMDVRKSGMARLYSLAVC